MTFAKRLKEERVRLGLTQADVGRLTEISLTTQANYEANRSMPTVEYLEKLAFHGFNIQYIITGMSGGGMLSVPAYVSPQDAIDEVTLSDLINTIEMIEIKIGEVKTTVKRLRKNR